MSQGWPSRGAAAAAGRYEADSRYAGAMVRSAGKRKKMTITSEDREEIQVEFERAWTNAGVLPDFYKKLIKLMFECGVQVGRAVSNIAKQYGGGGHANAAGFTLPADSNHPWLKEELSMFAVVSTDRNGSISMWP